MLVNGKIQKGDNCPYVDECGFKYTACNGDGCPFSRSDKHTVDFSCAAARLFKVIAKSED